MFGKPGLNPHEEDIIAPSREHILFAKCSCSQTAF